MPQSHNIKYTIHIGAAELFGDLFYQALNEIDCLSQGHNHIVSHEDFNKNLKNYVRNRPNILTSNINEKYFLLNIENGAAAHAQNIIISEPDILGITRRSFYSARMLKRAKNRISQLIDILPHENFEIIFFIAPQIDYVFSYGEYVNDDLLNLWGELTPSWHNLFMSIIDKPHREKILIWDATKKTDALYLSLQRFAYPNQNFFKKQFYNWLSDKSIVSEPPILKPSDIGMDVSKFDFLDDIFHNDLLYLDAFIQNQ